MKKKISSSHARVCLGSLASFLDSGVPMVAALSIMRDAYPKYAVLYETCIEDISAGRPLYLCFENILCAPTLAVSMIRLGEESGLLKQLMRKAALSIEKSASLRLTIGGALIYPIIITLALGGLMIGMSAFMMPQLIPMFTSMHVDLPITTKIVIFIYYFFSSYLFYILGAFIFLSGGIALLFHFKKEHITGFFEYLLFKTPAVRVMSATYARQRLFFIVGTMLDSGMLLSAALEAALPALPGKSSQKALREIIGRIESGLPFSEALRGTIFFAPDIAAVIKIGEETGTLARSAIALSDALEETLRRYASTFTKLIEPLLMLVLAIAVGFLALAIITPMYALTSHVSQ